MCILSPSDIRVPIFCSFCIFQQLCSMECVISKSVAFRAHKKTQCYADQFSVLYLVLFTLSIHSHLSVLDFISHIHNICFVAHQVGLLQNVRALSSLTALLQVSNGRFHEVTVSKPSSERRWSGAMSVIEWIIVIRFSLSYCWTAGTNDSADTEL
jgi:hypothetical protein